MYYLVTTRAKSCFQVIRLEYGALLDLELENWQYRVHTKLSAHTA